MSSCSFLPLNKCLQKFAHQTNSGGNELILNVKENWQSTELDVRRPNIYDLYLRQFSCSLTIHTSPAKTRKILPFNFQFSKITCQIFNGGADTVTSLSRQCLTIRNEYNERTDCV